MTNRVQVGRDGGCGPLIHVRCRTCQRLRSSHNTLDSTSSSEYSPCHEGGGGGCRCLISSRCNGPESEIYDLLLSTLPPVSRTTVLNEVPDRLAAGTARVLCGAKGDEEDSVRSDIVLDTDDSGWMLDRGTWEGGSIGWSRSLGREEWCRLGLGRASPGNSTGAGSGSGLLVRIRHVDWVVSSSGTSGRDWFCSFVVAFLEARGLLSPILR